MLTAKQLASIMAADMAPDTRGHELRRARRFPYHGEIQIRLQNSHLQETVTVLDISTRGLRINCSHDLPRNATFVAVFPRFEGRELLVLCTVAHCHGHANRLFTIGAEFTCVLAETTPTDAKSQDRIRQAILDSGGN
jgi:hypothetical protein